MKVTNSWFERGLEQGLEQGREEGLEQGRELGLEQGREEGLEQGRQAMRESAFKILEKRFGPTPPDLRKAIESLKDDTQLSSVIVAAAEVDSPEEFLKRLSAGNLD